MKENENNITQQIDSILSLTGKSVVNWDMTHRRHFLIF